MVIDLNPPATLAEGLDRSIVYPVFLLTVTSGITAFAWNDGSAITAGAYTYALGDGSGVLNESVDEISGATFNGTALTQVFSLGALVAGSFMWDYENQRVAMIAPGSVDPKANGATVELFATYRFSSVATDIGGLNWNPWLVGMPSVLNRIAADFNGITQIGGASIKLQNEDKYFDGRVAQNWDAGTCKLSMGLSGMAYGTYQDLATWTPSSVSRDDQSFTINVQEAKVLIDTLFPTILYDNTTYPDIDPQSIGSPIQWAYGKILGVKPVLIDSINLVFKVAGHAIKSFDDVRVLDVTSNAWVTANFASVDVALAEFTMNPAEYSVGQSIVVDFSGKTRGNGTLMDNPAEIASDLIQALGFAVDTAGFEVARLWYDIGYFQSNGSTINRATIMAPSLYLDVQAKALGTLEEVMAEVRAYLTSNELGQFTMIPFRCYQVADLPLIDDVNALNPGLMVDGSGTSNFRVQAGQKVSQAQVQFGIRPIENISETAVYTSPATLYTRNLRTDVPVVVTSLFTAEADAMALAQALVNEYRVDPYIYTVSVKWLGFTWRAGQHVHVVSTIHAIDIVCEVLQVQLDLTKRVVKLTLNNLRGFYEASGFWVDDADVTPSGASLSWPANGQKSDPDETQYRRHQAGHWHENTDFPLVAAAATQLSDQDHAVSRFQ